VGATARSCFTAGIRVASRSVAWFCIAISAGPAAAAELTGYAVLTSDYVHRGVTYSDGHIAAQIGGDVEYQSGFYLGIWGSTIDIENGPSLQREREINYYLGYTLDISNHWSLGANAVAYVFPGATGSIDYDYEEFSVSANYRDRAWLEYSFSPDLYNTGYDTHNIDLLIEWPLPNAFTAGTGVGYYDVSELTGSGYAYWQVGVSRPIGIFDVDLRYHDTNRWVPFVSTEDRADSRVSLSIRVHF